jgi:hypothetical protein
MAELNEVPFRKSSYCGSDGECVECGFAGGEYVLRDSKDPAGPVLRFSKAELDAFVAGYVAGEFDLS